MVLESNEFNDLKREIEDEDKGGKLRKIIPAAALACVLIGVAIVMPMQHHDTSPAANMDKRLTTSEKAPATKDPSPEDQSPATPAKDPGVQTIQSEPQQTPSGSTQSAQVATFNEAEFISQGRSMVAHYNDIVGLVTFGPSATHEQKVSAIQRAYALDRQYFAETTNLRRIVSQADSAPDRYVNLMNLAESGVAAVSAGVDEMYRWSTGSSTSSLESGSSMIGGGSESLLQFSRQL